MNMITVENMNMNNEWTEVRNKKTYKHHPCQYCGNKCYGIQCKDCHLKMVAEQNSECIDCKVTFKAIRKDGSKRKRCLDCQKNYSDKYFKNCPDCSKSFRCLLDNGKVFDKCSDCHKNEIKAQEKQKIKDTLIYECKVCKQKTNHELCGKCFREKKSVEDTYMLSKCFSCGQRFKGNFKYCSKECKK